MLTKWFARRALLAPKGAFFSPVAGNAGGSQCALGHGWWSSWPATSGPPGPPPPPPHGPPPPPPHAPPGNGISSGVNASGSFNGSTITDSFNNTITNTVILMPTQQAALAGLFSASLGLANALSNPQLGTLLNDEIALGVDTYLNTLGLSSVIPSLPGDIATLNAAISASPLESTLIGQTLGNLAFDVTVDALMAAQPKI